MRVRKPSTLTLTLRVPAGHRVASNPQALFVKNYTDRGKRQRASEAGQRREAAKTDRGERQRAGEDGQR